VTFSDFLRMLWQRKLLVVAVAAVVIGIAYSGTRLVTPEYESTSTLALNPRDLNNSQGLFVFGILDAIVPVYADAATSQTTKDEARRLLGRPLEEVSVATFKGTGLIKITSRSTNPRLAQRSAQALTDALLARAASGDVGNASLRLSEIDRAPLSTTPVYPRTGLTLLVATLLGLGLGIGAAFLRESLSTKVWTVDELAQVTGLPVYAEIPEEVAVFRLTKPEKLVTDVRLNVVAEALRELRTNLVFAESDARSIVVTSPDGSHGKTTVAFGLAVTFARAGTPTLLLDADLRRGRVPEMLALPRSPGLMEIMLDEVPVEEAIHHTSLETLDIITSGRRAGDPSELLAMEFPSILSQLEERYQAVIVDTTPIVPISDARVASRFADATLVVAAAGAVRGRQLRGALDRLSLISVRPTAAVLNQSKSVMGSKYYLQADVEQLPPPSGGTQKRRAVWR
jgi:capsular exopolysaccharide synthesis family protein